MPNRQVPATTEGVPSSMQVLTTEILNAEDLVYEGAHLAQLIFMAIEGMTLDEEAKALSAGIHVLQRKLLDAAHLMDLAKQTPK